MVITIRSFLCDIINIFFFLQISRYSLKDLDLLGQDMSYVPLQEIGVLKNLRTLGLAAVKDFGQVIESF